MPSTRPLRACRWMGGLCAPCPLCSHEACADLDLHAVQRATWQRPGAAAADAAVAPALALPQDAREDLVESEAAVAQLQAQVDALVAAGEMAAEVAAQLEEDLGALQVGVCRGQGASAVLLLPASQRSQGGSGTALALRAGCLRACPPGPSLPAPCLSCPLIACPMLAPPCPVPQEKRAYLAEALEQQQAAFLLVMTRFVGVLAAGHGSAAGDAMHTGGQAGTVLWRTRLMGQSA